MTTQCRSNSVGSAKSGDPCFVFRREDEIPLRNNVNHLPSKSMSMTNLNNRNLDRIQMRSNVSTISTDSNTSINSLGKKRRAPLPPPSKLISQVSIPEETPSMVQIESNLVPKEEVRRVLPEVPKVEVPKPEPAPRNLLEEAKVDKDMKKKRNKSKKDISAEDLRALSPDSALASSESSGSSLRKMQGKPHSLVRITPYGQFKPVVRKSSKIQEKIAIFSTPNERDSAKTIGKVFPIPRQQRPQIKVKIS